MYTINSTKANQELVTCLVNVVIKIAVDISSAPSDINLLVKGARIAR